MNCLDRLKINLIFIFLNRSSEDGEPAKPKASMVNLETSASNNNNNNSSSGSADLLGLGLAGGNGGSEEASQPSVNGNGFSQEAPTNNLSKYVYSCNNVQSVKGFPFLGNIVKS